MRDSAILEMLPFVPIVVGLDAISDMRGREKDAVDVLESVFELLDRRFPRSPKVLLTTLLTSADRGAAEEALKFGSWKVVVSLALPQTTYLNMLPDSVQTWFDHFVTRTNVRITSLAPLTDTLSRQPFRTEDLEASSHDASGPIPDHLEHGRLFVADHCQLLISVQDSQSPPSGIDIAAYKRWGRLDPSTVEIVGNSGELTPSSRLDPICVGPVWQIDMSRLNATDPLASILSSANSTPDQQIESTLVGSLPLADRFEDFNRHLASAQGSHGIDVSTMSSSGRNANSILQFYANGISAIQMRSQWWARRSIWLLAAIFVAAACAFELYLARTDVRYGRIDIAVYAVLVTAAIGVYWFTLHRRWQARAEEYRAVVEALRVQVAWWDSGLCGREDRVERFYLQGTRGALRLIRDAVHGLIQSALLFAKIAEPIGNAHLNWILGQIAYFERRIQARKRALFAVEILSWLFFAASFVAAVVLLMLHAVSDSIRAGNPDSSLSSNMMMQNRYNEVLNFLLTAEGMIVVSVLAILCVAIIGATLARRPFIPVSLGKYIVGTIVLAVAALALFDLIEIGRIWYSRLEEDKLSSIEEWAAAGAPFFAALAAGVRYVAEKLSWRAELHGYEEALEFFRRAKIGLAEIEAANVTPSEKEHERRQIIRSLGQGALAESERWLRSHRDRPLEPISGG